MFKRLFRQKQSRVAPVSRIMLFLNKIVKRKAERAAQVLSHKAQKLTAKQLRRFLYAFACMGILLNVTIMIAAIKNQPATKGLSIKNISKRHFTAGGQQLFMKNRKTELEQILKLETFLDSMKQTETGKKQVEQFMQEHPGFSDSIQLCKRLYGGT